MKKLLIAIGLLIVLLVTVGFHVVDTEYHMHIISRDSVHTTFDLSCLDRHLAGFITTKDEGRFTIWGEMPPYFGVTKDRC